MKHLIRLGLLLFVGLLGGRIVEGQAKPLAGGDVPKIYERLLKQIDQIAIYDNHSHATFPDDSDMDAQASPPGESTVVRLRDTNPEFVAGAKALFGYPYDDFKPEHAKWLIDKKKAVEATGGTAYWNGILDKLNIETCLANRVALAPYLDPKRFHWVFFVDSFLFPFDNRDQTGKNSDMGVFIPLQEKVLQRYMKQQGISALSADLAGYESFVRQTVVDNQKRGGVAMKFEAAYFRSLYFSDPLKSRAETIYAKYHAGQVASEEEYRIFQDYIFRVLIDQAGKLKLPVHFHSAVGIGDYFSLRQGHPLNLENVLRDPRYKNVNFVLIHGGYPYHLEMIWLTAAKNIYTDSSLMGYYVYPSELKNILKQWISLYPEKIMFGSDAFPFNEAVGAEETFWLAVRSARTAVAAALAELVAEGAFTEDKAIELARLYLHDNAAMLYGDKK
ncbi:MAG TPA: amidohydrolase family protein [Candidatus Dormibacteraeota bacterium]|nr:amidohydrolase family protein [Candidatus Dormibacteraeota bacterium]